MADSTDQGTQVYITKLTEPDALFCRFPGQNAQQPTNLELDLEDGELTAGHNPGIGVIPEAVYHRRTLWIDMPCLTADKANELMEEVKPLAQRILDGASIKWDGHNNVGVLNDDAQAAYAELADRCNPSNLANAWESSEMVEELDAGDWFSGVSRSEVISQFELTADTTDAEIAAKAKEAEDEARTGGEAGYTVLSGIAEYLTGIREDLRSDLYDKLDEVAEHIADLTEKRNYLISQIRGWNTLSDRQIAATAGMSHTQVRLIDERIRKQRNQLTDLANLILRLRERYLDEVDDNLVLVAYTAPSESDEKLAIAKKTDAEQHGNTILVTGADLLSRYPREMTLTDALANAVGINLKRTTGK